MDNSVIGSQIAKFRKASGLTQEELSRAAGVSTQAVSRWECGGTPDVTLLPAIADRLGVTIDALFGREGGQVQDIHETIRNWIRSQPRDQIMDRLNRLIWSAVSAIPSDYVNAMMPYPESCCQMNLGGKFNDILNHSVLHFEDGIYFGVGGNDFSFTTLCPRPEKGYDAYLPDKDTIRRFLSLLVVPGCLEVLEYMLRKDNRYYSADLLAKGAGLEPKAVSEILQKLTQTGLVESMEVELLQGTTKVYVMEESNAGAFLVFQYLARCLENPTVLNYTWLSFRDNPLL